jgi:hypothetical protein
MPIPAGMLCTGFPVVPSPDNKFSSFFFSRDLEFLLTNYPPQADNLLDL